MDENTDSYEATCPHLCLDPLQFDVLVKYGLLPLSLYKLVLELAKVVIVSAHQ